MRKPENRLGLALLLLAVLLATAGGREALAQISKPVLVVNDPGSPVPIRDTENPAHSAFQIQSSGSLPVGSTSHTLLFPVPPGKRLVIETVSVSAQLPLGQRAHGSLITSVGGEVGTYLVTMVPDLASTFPEHHIGTPALRLYADPPNVHCSVFRDSSVGLGGLNCAISGYLVDHP